MRVDFHSHFLPGIDDGARTPEESIGILTYLKSCGIETVAATPHFAKHGERVASFLERRRDAVIRLNSFIEEKGIDRSTLPEIVLGAEVHLYKDLSERERLKELCYEGTDFILLELPFRSFEGWELEEVYNIMYQLKVKPVMAHINRYLDFYSKNDYEDMFFNGDFYLQFNTECVNTHAGISLLKKTLKRDAAVVFGCDIHSPAKVDESGLEKTLRFLDRLKDDKIHELNKNERSVLSNADGR